jgi:predicted PurR-regulated permease PerM
MEVQVATLLLITASVALASVVIGFAVNLTEQTLNGNTNPEIQRIQGLQDQLLNQTDHLLNQLQNITINEPYNQTLPQEP